MSDESLPINTPETLGVTPRFVLQHNAISRSIHNVSATAKKVIALAMALIPPDLSSLTASFTFTDFCKAIGAERGGESYRIFIAAVDECMESVITVETEPNTKGKKKWEKFTWFIYAKYDEETGKATLKFSTELATMLLELKRFYAKINLKDLGLLQGTYAIRLFELAKSYESLHGKDGNPDQAWYFERGLSEIRTLLGVPEEAYPQTKHFRQFVVENPIKEINKAGIGLEIEAEGVKQGRYLMAIRFNCKQTPRKVQSKRRRSQKAVIVSPELATITLKTADGRTEKDMELLKERYPQEFAELYTAELEKPSFMPPTSEIRKLAAEGAAVETLKARHGIIK